MWWKNFEGFKSRFTRSFFYSRETDSPLIAEKSCSLLPCRYDRGDRPSWVCIS